MNIGYRVTCIKLFPEVSSLCGFGSDNGKFGIFDGEGGQIIFNSSLPEPISIISPDDDRNLYICSGKKLYLKDSRSDGNPILLHESESNIVNFCKQNYNYVIATESDGIILDDKRMLTQDTEENKRAKQYPVTDMCFMNQETIITVHCSGDIYIWNYDQCTREQLETTELVKARKMGSCGLACVGDKIAVSYIPGVSLYSSKKLVDFTSFNQKELLKAMCHAPCFDEQYIICSFHGGILVPIDLSDLSVKNQIKLSGDEVTQITSNHLFVCALTDENTGNIAVMLPEDFGMTTF